MSPVGEGPQHVAGGTVKDGGPERDIMANLTSLDITVPR